MNTGYILTVKHDHFTARLDDDRLMEISLDLVDERDRDLVVERAVFYLTDRVTFPPPWTAEELRQAKEKAVEFRGLLFGSGVNK